MGLTELLLKHGYYAYVAGVALAGLAFLLLVVTAFRTRLRWGLLVLLIPPTAVIFAIRHTRRTAIPLLLFGISVILLGIPMPRITSTTLTSALENEPSTASVTSR